MPFISLTDPGISLRDSFVVEGRNIRAGTITAEKLSIISLDAITATMGTLLVDGTLTMGGSGLIKTAPSGTKRLEIGGLDAFITLLSATNVIEGYIGWAATGYGAEDLTISTERNTNAIILSAHGVLELRAGGAGGVGVWVQSDGAGGAPGVRFRVSDAAANVHCFEIDTTGTIKAKESAAPSLVEIYPKNYISAGTVQGSSLSFSSTDSYQVQQVIACEYANQPVLVEVHVLARALIGSGNWVGVRPRIQGTIYGASTPVSGHMGTPTANQPGHSHAHPAGAVFGISSVDSGHSHGAGSYDVVDAASRDPVITVTDGGSQHVTVSSFWLLETTADGSGNVTISAACRLASGGGGSNVAQIGWKISRR